MTCTWEGTRHIVAAPATRFSHGNESFMPSYELLAAVCRTDYRVELPNRNFSIRLGFCSPELEQLLEESDHTEWSIVTAENPRSVQLTAPENTARRKVLQRRLDEAGQWASFSTVAICLHSEWPPEHGCLIMGISEHDALVLARNFGQHAILCGTAGTQAVLRLTHPASWRVSLDSGINSDDDLFRNVCQDVLAAQCNS